MELSIQRNNSLLQLLITLKYFVLIVSDVRKAQLEVFRRNSFSRLVEYQTEYFEIQIKCFLFVQCVCTLSTWISLYEVTDISKWGLMKSLIYNVPNRQRKENITNLSKKNGEKNPKRQTSRQNPQRRSEEEDEHQRRNNTSHPHQMEVGGPRTHKTTTWDPRTGHRNVGRQKRRWADDLKLHFGSNWTTKAKDGRQWKDLTATASAKEDWRPAKSQTTRDGQNIHLTQKQQRL